MNILHLSPNFDYSCGVSKHVFDILNFYSDDPNVNLKFITNGGDALSKLFDIGIKPYIINFKQGITNVLFFSSNLFELHKYCIQNNIDIIHTHHRYPELLSVILSKKLKLKTITTAHSIVEGYKQFSFKSDKIIAVSNTVKSMIIRNYNVLDSRITLLYNCLPNMKNLKFGVNRKSIEELGIKESEFVILFLGRLNKIKGIDILVNAFRKIKPAYPNIKLILLGEILDDTYKEINVKSDEDIIRFIARNDIKLFLELCNIVILPSREDPFPYVMLEAGIAHKPFIGSSTGGIAEFIEDGVNGFLFEAGNADDLAEKIEFVINNPEKAKSAAEELHKKVKKHCNCEEYFAELTNIYNELLNE